MTKPKAASHRRKPTGSTTHDAAKAPETTTRGQFIAVAKADEGDLLERVREVLGDPDAKYPLRIQGDQAERELVELLHADRQHRHDRVAGDRHKRRRCSLQIPHPLISSAEA
jgi:hypothetical protein